MNKWFFDSGKLILNCNNSFRTVLSHCKRMLYNLIKLTCDFVFKILNFPCLLFKVLDLSMFDYLMLGHLMLLVSLCLIERVKLCWQVSYLLFRVYNSIVKLTFQSLKWLAYAIKLDSQLRNLILNLLISSLSDTLRIWLTIWVDNFDSLWISCKLVSFNFSLICFYSSI